MGYGILYGSRAILAQETVIERGLRHAARLSERTELLIGKIAGHIAKRLAIGVAADNGQGNSLTRMASKKLSSLAWLKSTMMPCLFISFTTRTPKSLNPRWVFSPLALSQISLSPL